VIDRIGSRITFAIIVITIASIALGVVITTTSGNNQSSVNSSSSSDNSGIRIVERVVTYNYTTNKQDQVFKYIRPQDQFGIGDAVPFLDPYGKSMSSYYSNQQTNSAVLGADPNATLTDQQKQSLMKDSDAYEWYVLVRLPNTTAINNTASGSLTELRSYSALDPESKCLLQYRNDASSGAVLEDLCHDDIFRASDGYSCFGHIAVGTNPVVSGYNAIPVMRLSIDSRGYVVALKPDGQLAGDGTVGEGRILSDSLIQADSKIDNTCNQYSHLHG
jgi:hypothetical protein